MRKIYFNRVSKKNLVYEYSKSGCNAQPKGRLLPVVIHYLSRISVVTLLTCFCTALNEGFIDTRMTTTRQVGSTEGG